MATPESTNHFLNCVVCHKVFTDPSTLACGHSFCGQCIVDSTKTSEDAIRSGSVLCPFCWRLTSVPDPSRPVEEWAGQIRQTLLLKSLLDAPASDDKDITNCHLCHTEGETTPAVSWCSVCDVSLCSNCLKAHRRNPASSHHAVEDLTGEVKVTRNRKVTCSEHKEEIVKFFCRDCRKTLCQSCCIIYHRKCESVVFLESMLQEMRSCLHAREESLIEQSKYEEKHIEFLKIKCIEAAELKSSIESQIRSAAKKAIETIHEKEKELLVQLNDVTDKQTNQLNSDLKSRTMARDIYMQQSQLIDKALESQRDMEVFDLYQAPGSIRELKKRTRTRVKFTRHVLDRALSQLSLGKIEVVNEVHLDKKDCRTKEDEFNPIVYDIRTLVVKRKYTILVADSRNKCIKSFYNLNSRQHHSYLKMQTPPAQMAKLENNMIAVTLPATRQIAIVSVSPDLSLEAMIETDKEYTGLTALTPTTLAAGASSSPGVDILDIRGRTVRSISPRLNGATVIRQPDFLSTTRQGNILLCDLGTKSVVCLTPRGKVVFIYSPSGEDELRGLRGITTSAEGDIYVVDHWRNTVIQLGESGEFVRDLLTSLDGVCHPWGIHSDERGRIFVTREGEDGGDTIQVFTMK